MLGETEYSCLAKIETTGAKEDPQVLVIKHINWKCDFVCHGAVASGSVLLDCHSGLDTRISFQVEVFMRLPE